MSGFERSALGLIAVLVAVLVGAVVLRPLDPTTAAPRASLGAVVSLPVPPPPKAPVLIENLIATAPARADTVAERRPAHQTTGTLDSAFARLGYDLKSVGAGERRVPRLFLAAMPHDMDDVPEADRRKALFFKAMLPLVLQVNEEILTDRRRLWSLRYGHRLGLRPSAADRLWLQVMYDRYNVTPGDLDGLLPRVDAVPPSLALAQAAEESGWGTSRFAREGNAVFGQWTTAGGDGLVPARRDEDKAHVVRRFDDLLASARSYARNLNTHRAYRGFRKARAGLRALGNPLGGLVLAKELRGYSARGGDYVRTLGVIIRTNGLHRLDRATLHDGEALADPPI